jgi:hypothetical protein
VELIRDLLIFVAVMFALLIVLIVVVSLLPESNPLKRILTALSYRLGVTFMAGAIAVPVEPVPGLDVLYDVVVPIALIWYWYTFFRDAAREAKHSQPMRDVTPKDSGSRVLPRR